MNPRILVVAGLLAAAPLASQAQQTEVVVAPVVVSGEVIRYEPGRAIVLKSDGREVSYVLTPELALPADVQLGRRVSVHTERGERRHHPRDPGRQHQRDAAGTGPAHDGGDARRRLGHGRAGEADDGDGRSAELRARQDDRGPTGDRRRREPGARRERGEPDDVQVGQRVTLYTEPGVDGTTSVSRITTTAITPEGQTKRTVEETRTAPTGETTKTTTVNVQGTVKTYLPGKTLTVLKADGTPVTYTIAPNAAMPADLAVGKVVSVRSIPGGTMQIVVEKN